MPINITPQAGFGGRLAQALAGSVGSYGQGYAKQAPQLLDARRSGATTAAITLAPMQNAMDQFGASFRQSYQLAGQMAMQREAINAQKASQASAHQQAMDMLDRRTAAAANEQFMKMTNGAVALTDIKGPDGSVLIPGISTLWQQQYDADPVHTPPLERFKIDYMQKVANAREDAEMLKKGFARGPDPDEEKQLQAKIDDLDPGLFPKGTPDWDMAVDILRKTFPQKPWHAIKPTPAQITESQVVPKMGPDGKTVVGYAFPKGVSFQQSKEAAGGARGSTSRAGQPPVGPDGRPITTADQAIDTFAKATGVTTTSYDGKGGLKESTATADVYVKSFTAASDALSKMELPAGYKKDDLFDLADEIMDRIERRNRRAVEGPPQMAPHIASMYTELESFRLKYEGNEGGMPPEEKKKFQQLYGLYKKALSTQPSE